MCSCGWCGLSTWPWPNPCLSILPNLCWPANCRAPQTPYLGKEKAASMVVEMWARNGTSLSTERPTWNACKAIALLGCRGCLKITKSIQVMFLVKGFWIRTRNTRWSTKGLSLFLHPPSLDFEQLTEKSVTFPSSCGFLRMVRSC